MNNLFNAGDKNEIINRIDELHPDSKPLWGKMNISQMLAHCVMPIKVSLGEAKLKHTVIGMLFGKTVKKKMLKEDYVFEKNLPTDKNFVIKNTEDFYKNQQSLKDVIERVSATDKNQMALRRHPFFGKMTADEWGILGYKHLDHHLRQFGV